MGRVYRVRVSAVGERLEGERMNGGGHRVAGVFRFDVGADDPGEAAELVARRLTFGVERREFGSGGQCLTSDMNCTLGSVVWVPLNRSIMVERVRIRDAEHAASWQSITGVDKPSALVVEVSEHGYNAVRNRRINPAADM